MNPVEDRIANLWSLPLELEESSETDAANCVAGDEALVRQVDADPQRGVLRLWEVADPAVIVGRSNDIAREVDVAACERDGVPILRRASGGGAVVLGTGCLCYALALPIDERHRQRGVTAITADIMRRLAAAWSTPEQAVTVQGVSDLVVMGRKFSGNSQRWLKRALLHHGTVLYEGDLARIGRYLRFPSRVPDYRGERSHAEFVGTLPMSRAEIITRLRAAWC